VEDRNLRSAPFFSGLSAADQERVSERMHLEVRRSGETLFRRGDESSALYLIRSGWVRLLADGGILIASQGPGNLVGETDVFLGRPRSIGASVASDAEFWVLTAHDLVDLIAENPQTGIDLSVAFGSRIALLDQYLVERRLRAVPALQGLKDSVLFAIARRLAPAAKRRGEMVVERGQAPQGLFLIESGCVQVQSAEQGGGASERRDGETCGEMALLTGQPYGTSVQAVTNTVLWILSAADFELLAAEYPEIRVALSAGTREPVTTEDRGRAAERLSKMPLFSGLPQEVLAAVAERMVVRHVPAGELAFSEGTPGDFLYLIDSGQVEITTSARPGAEILARMGANQYFGEMALLTGKPRATAARAVTHTTLWGLSRSDFLDLANRYPAISLALNRVLSERLADMDRRSSEGNLRAIKLLAGLSSSQLEDVSRRLRRVRFQQGQTIIHEGEPGDEMFLVQVGRVQVVEGSGRHALPLAELGMGDLFGEIALLTGNLRTATVIALTDVDLWVLGKADFDELVAAYPALALALSRLLSERLRSADERFLRGAPRLSRAAQVRPAARTAAVASASQPQPTAAARPARREPRAGLVVGAKAALENAGNWYGTLSRGAKVRLVLIALLVIWLIGIAAPALLISALAADHVTNLNGAIAFVQRDTTLPAEAIAGAEDAAAATIPAPDMAVKVQPLLAESASALQEAATLEPTPEPTQAPPTPVPATATPYIIVVTSTPVPVTDTPVPTATPVPPTATPKPKAKAAEKPPAQPAPKAQPPRDLDPRLGALNVGIVEPAGLTPGQSYWRLMRVRWEDKKESGNDHTIYIDVLDENGARIIGQPVQIDWPDGTLTVYTEDKPPTVYSANFPQYGLLGSYTVFIPGGPSDRIVGLGMGTPTEPYFMVHTNWKLTYQRTTW
jgi:CRP-like cAMP-binding protein